MPQSSRSNKDDRLYNSIVNLRKHLASCYNCRGAIKGKTANDMCQTGISMTLDCAIHFDHLISLRIAAHNHPGRVIFACPDLTKHGSSYALTALPMLAVGAQDGFW